MRSRSVWVTPTLVTLSSGSEAQANKRQSFTEGDPGDSCVDEDGVGVACPGDPDQEGDLEGMS